MKRKYANGYAVYNVGSNYPEIIKIVIRRGIRGSTGKGPRYEINVYYKDGHINQYNSYEKSLDRVFKDFRGEIL